MTSLPILRFEPLQLYQFKNTIIQKLLILHYQILLKTISNNYIFLINSNSEFLRK